MSLFTKNTTRSNWNSLRSKLSLNKPQMNAPSRASGGRIHVCLRAYVSMYCGGHDADERRFVISTHRKGREERKAEQEVINRSMGKSGNHMKNEPVRTDTNSSHCEFVRVSFSSLLMFILLHIFIVIYERSSEDTST